MVKNLTANIGGARDMGSIPGSGISLEGGNGNPLQDFGLQNSMDRGAWQAMVLIVVNHDMRILCLNLLSVQSIQSHLTLDPRDCSTRSIPVHHQLLEFTQAHVH